MKLFRTIVAGLLLAILPCIYAAAQSINDLDITVRLLKNGDAEIVQLWDVTISASDNGTEWYVPVNDMSSLEMQIKDLKVVEDGNVFVSEGDDWVTKGRSRREKAGRSGIVHYTDGSLDLCWGFGTTGNHKWTVSYTLTNLIQSMNGECDAFIHQFVNDDLPAPPEHVKLTVVDAAGTAAWEPAKNVRAWAFGFDGNVSFSGDSMIAETNAVMKKKGSVIIMMRFDSGMYAPARTRDKSFARMQKEAFEGSDYEYEEVDSTGTSTIAAPLKNSSEKKSHLKWGTFWEILESLWNIIEEYGWLVLSAIIIAFSALFAVIRRAIIKTTGKRWRQNIFGECKIAGWWREAPLDRNLDAAYSLLKKGDKLAGDEKYDNGIVGAYFLRWIADGILKVVAEDPTATKQKVNLALTDKTPSGDSIAEYRLYLMVAEAAGENRILEKNEFQKWSRAHYNSVCNWPSSVINSGMQTWQAKTPEERKRLVQLKNFLKDFTLINERDANQVMLWKDYLIYAQLFGIADKVAENFQKLYPAEFVEFTNSMGMSTYGLLYTLNTTTSYANLMMYSAQTRQREVQAEQFRSSGGGGHSSFGGGGGFSGGGHGGGTR